MPKRQREETSEPSKRIRLRQDHEVECNDPSCQDCAEGEIELTFLDESGKPTKVQPDAIELYHMAREEAQVETEEEHGKGVAKRLFDLALESFSQDTDADEAKREQYARCLIDFGRYYDVEESAKEGLDILRGIEKRLQKTNDTHDARAAHVWIWMGKGELTLAGFLRKAALALAEEQLGSDEEAEESGQEAGLSAPMSKGELSLVKTAVPHYNQAITILCNEDKAVYVQALYSVTVEAQQYLQQLTHPDHAETVVYICDSLMDIFKADSVPKAELYQSSNFSPVGMLQYHKAKAIIDLDRDDKEKAIKEAIEMLSTFEQVNKTSKSPETPSINTLQMLAQAHLLLSTISEDDDEVMQAFEDARACLVKAKQLQPGNVFEFLHNVQY